MKFNIKKIINDHLRVLKIAKKPSDDEFKESLNVSLIGMLVVGATGFLVYLISVLFLS